MPYRSPAWSKGGNRLSRRNRILLDATRKPVLRQRPYYHIVEAVRGSLSIITPSLGAWIRMQGLAAAAAGILLLLVLILLPAFVYDPGLSILVLLYLLVASFVFLLNHRRMLGYLADDPKRLVGTLTIKEGRLRTFFHRFEAVSDGAEFELGIQAPREKVARAFRLAGVPLPPFRRS